MDNTGGVLDDFNVLVNTPSKTEEIDSHKLSSSVLKSLLLGEPIEKTSKTPEVILVVFSDFECPFCARYFQDVI
ncbi:MAG: DsbA family protein [bacterium]